MAEQSDTSLQDTMLQQQPFASELAKKPTVEVIPQTPPSLPRRASKPKTTAGLKDDPNSQENKDEQDAVAAAAVINEVEQNQQISLEEDKKKKQVFGAAALGVEEEREEELKRRKAAEDAQRLLDEKEKQKAQVSQETDDNKPITTAPAAKPPAEPLLSKKEEDNLQCFMDQVNQTNADLQQAKAEVKQLEQDYESFLKTKDNSKSPSVLSPTTVHTPSAPPLTDAYSLPTTGPKDQQKQVLEQKLDEARRHMSSCQSNWDTAVKNLSKAVDETSGSPNNSTRQRADNVLQAALGQQKLIAASERNPEAPPTGPQPIAAGPLQEDRAVTEPPVAGPLPTPEEQRQQRDEEFNTLSKAFVAAQHGGDIPEEAASRFSPHSPLNSALKDLEASSQQHYTAPTASRTPTSFDHGYYSAETQSDKDEDENTVSSSPAPKPKGM